MHHNHHDDSGKSASGGRRQSVRKPRANCSFEFLSLQEALLIMELTDTKEKAQRFMNHIRENYGEELKREAEERAALRASFGYAR
ncbi:hypothetical protein [Chitinophaga sp. YIM B06452]|uniref:hypothetical protein n=1 Tax=Chitinophaga sp. YIM B06452 TaxID=3082158 RepID=UPI0031FE6AC3